MKIIENDFPSTVDVLGRIKFAQQIVHTLTYSYETVDESMVIGICGKWGSGKTTLLTFIEKELNQYHGNDSEKFIVIHFNPWASTDLNEMQRDLLETILKSLKGVNWKASLSKSNETIKDYLKYLDYVKYLKYLHPVATNLFDSVEEYRKKINIVTLEDLRNDINKLIQSKGIRIYVMIDDLDRLEPAHITTVLKMLKLNTNFFNTFYFVAYDRAVVINSLRQIYYDNSENYLEKVIQVDFCIPELLEEQIEDIYFDRLADIVYKESLSLKRQDVFSVWKYHGLREYFRSPRDIKRYFNSLLLSLPNVGDNVNLLDFIVLEAIKVFDYNAYLKVFQLIIEIKRKSTWTGVSFDKEIIDTFTSSTTQALLNYLFMKSGYVSTGKESLVHKRLKDPEFFERYFSLSISRSDISEESVRLFLTNRSNRGQLLKEADEYGRMKNLLRRLGDKEIGNQYEVLDYGLFQEFLDFWDKNYLLITSELDEYIWHAYFNLAHSFKDKHKAAHIAIESLELSTSGFQPMKFVFNHFIFQFNENGRVDSEFYGELGKRIEVAIESLKIGFRTNMLKTCGSYFNFINQGKLYFPSKLFFYSFSKYCKKEYLTELEASMSNSNFLIFMLKNEFLMIDGQTKEPSRINLENKDIYFPDIYFEKYINKLQEIKTGAVREEDKVLIDFFLSAIQNSYS